MGVDQAQTVTHWVTYLSQQSSLYSSLLKEDLQKLLGPVMYHSDMPEEKMVTPPERNSTQDGKYS